MANNSINWLGNKVMNGNSDSHVHSTPAVNNSTTIPRTPESNNTQFNQEGPPPVMSIDYIPGYLNSIIGKNVRAEFIIGNSQYVDKIGKLIDVGVNYFVLEDVNSGTNIMCDLYSVKFVTTIV